MKWNIFSLPLGMGCAAGYNRPKKEIIPLAIPIGLAAAGALSSIWGGAKSASAARKAQRQVAEEKARTEAERLRAKYERWGDTASGQNTMRLLQEQADRFIRQQRGAAAVGGATDASVAREKELQNEKQAEVIAAANANFEDKKDAVDASYRQDLARLNQQEIATEQARSQAIAQAAGGASNAMLQGAMATFGGTNLGQQWFGTGSPGGSGVAPSLLDRVGGWSRNYGMLSKSALYNPTVFWNLKPAV